MNEIDKAGYEVVSVIGGEDKDGNPNTIIVSKPK
jgi:hypothetical protein